MPDRLGPRLGRILQSVQDALVDAPPGRMVLMPGSQIVWDDCCNGQLWVRVVGVEPIRDAGCLYAFRATIGVGVVRCAAVLDDQGRPPSAADVTADAVRQNLDLQIIGDTLACHDDVDALTRWAPAGPQGGCTAGEWQATVLYGVCDCTGA